MLSVSSINFTQKTKDLKLQGKSLKTNTRKKTKINQRSHALIRHNKFLKSWINIFNTLMIHMT